MSDPKRWSSAGSEVDPVLRAVLGYARDQRPSTAELQAILRGASARTPRKRRFVAFARGVALGLSLAGAGYAARSVLSPQPRVGDVALPPARGSARTPAPRELHDAAATTSGSATVMAAPRPPSAAGGGGARPQTERGGSAADAEREAALLQEARRAVLAEPARALTLTRDHELSFPESLLTEERQALRVEALARLGRSSEAEQELTGFEQRFPRSIYRRRLRSLVTR